MHQLPKLKMKKFCHVAKDPLRWTKDAYDIMVALMNCSHLVLQIMAHSGSLLLRIWLQNQTHFHHFQNNSELPHTQWNLIWRPILSHHVLQSWAKKEAIVTICDLDTKHFILRKIFPLQLKKLSKWIRCKQHFRQQGLPTFHLYTLWVSLGTKPISPSAVQYLWPKKSDSARTLVKLAISQCQQLRDRYLILSQSLWST